MARLPQRRPHHGALTAVPVLDALRVYPIKSARGLRPARWTVDAFGLRWDRRWMLVDRAGRFLSQREHPRLALVDPSLDDGALRVEAPAMPTLELPLGADGPALEVGIWTDRVAALRVGDDADAWFSRFLGLDARLVFLPETSLRPVDPGYATGDAQRVSFADGFPFLLTGTASLEELNRRLERPLPMDRFRPNLVVAGAPPFAEDGWRRIRIGAIELDVVKPCARCVVTTIDQRTAEQADEPLRTLARFRRVGSKVLFGQNLIHAAPGALAVGDPVTVLDPADAAP